MYGSCIQLSDTAVLAYTSGVCRLFKIAGNGAKEIATGDRLTLYTDRRLLVLGGTTKGIYTFDGDTIAEQNLLRIRSETYGRFIVYNGTGGGVIDSRGKIMLSLTYSHIRLFDNGIAEASEGQAGATWFNWEQLGKPDCATFKGTYGAVQFMNCLIILDDRHHGTVLDTQLHKLGGMQIDAVQRMHTLQAIELDTEGTVVTGGASRGPTVLLNRRDAGITWANAVEQIDNMQSEEEDMATWG